MRMVIQLTPLHVPAGGLLQRLADVSEYLVEWKPWRLMLRMAYNSSLVRLHACLCYMLEGLAGLSIARKHTWRICRPHTDKGDTKSCG